MKPVQILLITVLLLGALALQVAAQGEGGTMSFSTDYASWIISPDGKALSLRDKASGQDYAGQPAHPIAVVRVAGTDWFATSASFDQGKLTVGFGESGIKMVLGLSERAHYVMAQVLSVEGEGIEQLTFVGIPTRLTGDVAEPFSVCALALNLQTNVTPLPGQMTWLQAICYPRFGLVGAKVALIACPTAELRNVMKEAVTDAPELPHSPIGGPWALDAPGNRESYFFNFGDLTEETVDEWIGLAHNLGITQIDFHGGGSFRFGDCMPNPTMYPKGRASMKAVIDKLHAAGIKAGLHTYAHFISPECPWITPVPSKDLAKISTYTLTTGLGETDLELAVDESTEQISTVVGFFIRNSLILQVDDELMRFESATKEAPFTFKLTERGAFGTRVAAHEAGARVHHLKQCFFLFAPDGDSPLLEEVAATTADFYNECGFDMIYLDALDGEDVLGGWENAWHYGSKFTFEIVKRLQKPAIMEMSTFHHHLWYVRARMGAWDHPTRAYKTFVDLHCESNKGCDKMFLPAHLGWWRTILTPDFQQERTYPDDAEYLLAKCAAHQCGLSPQEFTPATYAASAYLQRIGNLYKNWEELRLAGFFTPELRAKLAMPDSDFSLTTNAVGQPAVREMEYVKHKVEGNSHPTSTWTVSNQFEGQPVKLRIEALLSAGGYDSPEAVILTDFSDPAWFAERGSSAGVQYNLTTSTEQVKTGAASGLFAADSPPVSEVTDPRVIRFSSLEHGQRAVEGTPLHCYLGAEFSPLKDLSGKTALGVWVYGDGQNEVLNLQLLSPHYMMSGYCDRYIIVDFTGWRYFELIESEGDRAETLAWPYSGNVYAMYRETITPAAIERMRLWYNLLPPGDRVECYLSPIKALPLVKEKVVHPTVTINGQRVTFPLELPTGCWLEYNGPDDCKAYDEVGNLLAEVKPFGETPVLNAGENAFGFECAPLESGLNPRTLVTVSCEGPIL